ncbi:ataxia telangiectasia mutated [Moesziomyces antarcticus]|uniref:Related to TEL1 - telomere length control protein n=2 Tax=Pseudozyma antarctica TaxID=84753 RepID=A0A5C3FS47_PSEA2|nr:ataxia telangiectasia mutated [Moesziomyces antarcticus]GAK67934.1 ataxia telangiectasia mutated [Moesziomyces antarcticus]SPO47273.1 related to TEL1 - telomere length control protein [Moesziomyces antarcticus]
MAFSLQEALEQIRSDKVKDRQQGLEAIDHIFADAENARNLDPKRDGRAWLKTFQSLFVCVLAEKTACIRKGSFVDAQPTALARLQRSAQTLRSLVDKSASLLTRKVVKALVIHIHQMLNHRGTLLQPIAPAYIAALCTILRHPHHVDHLDPEDWSAVASLCFDILLTRELGSDPTTPADAQQWLASAPSAQQPPLQRRGLSLEHAVTAECLSHLISSSVAPLLGAQGYGLPLLADYVRFLLAYPSESSAHLPTLTGLVVLLEHLELNHTSQVVLATLAVRNILLNLWKTKNQLLKAQLLLVFRMVTDPIASCALARPDAASSQHHALPSDDAIAFLQAIHDTLLNDPDSRWALEPLHMDALLLRWPQHPQPVHRDIAVINAAFSLSPTSSDRDALAWCRIGLHVDLIDALTTIARQPIDRSDRPATSNLDEHAAGPSTQASSSPAKRRRTTPTSSPQKRSRLSSHQPTGLSSEAQGLLPLIGMLSHTDASAPSSPAARLSAVQLLTFLVLCKPHLLTPIAIDHLQKCLLAVIADTDTATVSWSLLALASILLMHSDNADDASRLSSATQAWVIAARKLQLPATSRAAAYLLSVLLASSALPDSKLQPEIARLLADVDLQGPPMVCDSVCHLMALLLRHTTSNRAFHLLDPRAKIGAWLASTYSPAATISSSASNGPFVPYDDLIRLVDCIVAESHPQSSSRAPLDAFGSNPGAAFASAQRRARLQPLRNLVLRSTIALASLADTTLQTEVTAANPALMSAEALHRMTVVLDRNVDACLTALQDLTADTNGAASLTGHAAITALHLAILALDVGTKSTSQSGSHRTSSIRSCCQIIVRILAIASSVDAVRSGGYALAIEQLTLLLPAASAISDSSTKTNLLVDFGPSSGIAARLLAKEQPEQPRSGLPALDESSRRIWKAIRDANMLDTVLASCAKLFETTLFGDDEAEAEPSSQVAVGSGDVFDDVPESSSSTFVNATAAAHLGSSASIEVVIRSTVRLLLAVPRIVTGAADARHQELVVSSFFDCSVQGIVALAPVLFDSFRDGTLWMSHRDVNDALDRLGTELLASYRFARHQAARLATIRAVSCVMPLLLGELDEQSDLFDKVQKLSAFFADQIGRTKWPTPWEVQLACADFLAERLRLDPDGRLLRSGTARAPSASPVTALLKLHADPDVRVRALGSPIATSVVSTFTGSQADLDELYTIFRDGLPSDSTQPRLILTRALSLCNAAIASSSVRRSSIFYLLEIVLATGMLSSTVQELFAKLAARLGFPDASSCYQAFAGQITWGLATNGYDPLQLPWKVLGYASKRVCLEATFAACGSMLLATQTADGRTQFGALVQLTRRNRQQGLQECLPFLTAAYIGFAAQAEQGTSSNTAAICERTLRDLASLGVVEGDDAAALREMIVQADDLTISTLLLLFYQPGATLAESRASILEAIAPLDDKCAKTVDALTPTKNDGAASCHEPSRPFFSAAVLYTALAALPQLGIAAFAPQTVYNVLRHMFYHISTSRFVNDQVRMCAALRIYIAMCGDAFWKDALNNQLLIRSIERLLEQPQLHDEFRPLLVYACTASCLATKAPESLVSCIVAWSQQLAERLVASPASGAWLLEAANALARSSPVATSAVVLLWPVDLANTEHTAVESLVDIGTLTYALEACPTLSPRLPSLLRIRSVLTRAEKPQLAAFCNGPAWKLLERAADASRQRVGQAGDPLGDVINDIFTAIVGVQEAACLHREARRLGGKWNARAVEDFLEAADTSHIRSLSAAAILTVHQLAQDLPIEQGYQAYEALRDMAAVLDEPLAEVHPAKMSAAAKQELSRVRPGLGPPLTAPRSVDAHDVMFAELVDIASSADKWLCRMAAILCDLVASMPHLALFRPARRLVEANAEAAHALFPILLLCFTADDAAQGSSAIATENRRRSGGSATPSRAQRDQGLAATRAVIAQHFEAVLGRTTSDPVCSEIIVQALLALRAFRPVQSEPDNVCFWYRVDSSLLASRCIAAGQLTAAIFFLEHGIQNATGKPETTTIRSANQLLHQAYMNIDDPDAFYGITDGDVRDSVLLRLHHEGQWLRAFQYHAADYEACTSDGERRRAAVTLGQSLQHLGFPRLVDGIGLNVGLNDAGHDRFASAPNLGGSSTSTSWDLPLASQSLEGKAPSVEDVLHTLRQASAEQDVDAPLSHAFRSKLQALCSTSVESAKALRSLQGDLLALGQIKDWRRASSSMGAEEAVAHLRSQWVRVEASERFELTERVLDTRQSVLHAVRQRMHVDQIGDVLDGPVEDVARVERLLLVASSRRAREHGKLQKAINAVARAQRIEDALGDGEELAREEFAAVLWDQNEHSPAIQLLSQVVDGIGVTQSSSSSQKRRAARLLALLAQWRATARSQQPREIDRSLFEPALKLTAVPAASSSNGESSPAAAEQSEIAYRWARFAEQHHRDSDLAEITRLRLYTDRRREEIAQNQRECERTTSKTERSKLLQFQRQAEKILLQDETRLMELEASRTHFLRRSVAMYARALATSDEHDDAVPRLVSLWLEHAADAELNRLLSTCLPSIPSHKFVGLMHQLSARLTELPDAADVMVPFQTNLSRLLLRMCQEHPFHCLYAIFALIKTGADAKAAATHRPSPRSTLSVPEGGASQSASPPVLRSTAAEKIWTHIKRRSSLGKRIRTFEELCLAYVEWAEFDLTSRADRYFQNSGSIKKGALRMPPSGELRLARMRDLDIPVATARLEIDATCRYESFVSIVRYGETFTTAGGIHLPKISECIGSDGRRYKQLFKRDDDLRQDAVMQQVFRMVNGLLEADRRTRERKLAIRTYTVLPLGPQCGLLEFVTNTLPLGEVLIELHARYRPQDITPAQARAKLRDAQPMRAEAKLEAFLDVCQAMQPAMRYFFSDAQRMPRDWYATRLRYTRSVSTNSIVGHVLGLGDRHVSNILLDQASGELVHIDFGVAFDQGKLLPIPELVPFRLTRDLVDGMGVHGVEGTFRRCCEETLRVLRAHGDAIKTVLEVFRHDPLFAWTSNPIKVLRAQEAAAAAEEESVAASMDRSGSTATRVSRSTTPMVAVGDGVGAGVDTAELSADRAVSSVMSKLSSSLSVESTVNDLIQQAMDAGNLSAIFHGWQAAL